MFQFSAFLRAAFAMRAVNPIVKRARKPKTKELHDRHFARNRPPVDFRHAFLIFDLNEKKQRTESSNIQFLYGKALTWGELVLLAIHVFSMIFKFFSPFFLPLCTIYVKKHGRAYGKKRAQERGTDTQWGRRAGKHGTERRWNLRFSSLAVFSEAVVFFLTDLQFESLHAWCMGKCFRSLARSPRGKRVRN